MQSESPFVEGDPNNRPQQPGAHTRRSGSGSGCVTCLLIFIGVGFLSIILICSGMYYTLNHTSYPLQALKYAVESSGDIRIEGVSGSLSSGVHFDSLKTRSGDKWSSLNDIDFYYDQAKTKRGTDKFVVKRATIGSGEIFVEGLNGWDVKDNADGSTEFDTDLGTDEEIGDTASDFDSANSNGPGTRPTRRTTKIGNTDPADFAIDILQVKDLKFVNPDTDFEFTIDEITLIGFDVEEGAVIGLDDFVVKTEFIDLETKSTERFNDLAPGVIQKQFSGKISKGIHPSLVGDISFDVHSAFEGPGQGRYDATLFGGKLKTVGNGDESSVELNDFTADDYFVNHDIVPSHVTAKMEAKLLDKRNQKYKVKILSGATFQLGETVFQVETSKITYDKTSTSFQLKAKGIVDGEDVDCTLQMNKNSTAFNNVELTAGDEKNTPDLFAKVVFQKTFAELTKVQQTKILASLAPVVNEADKAVQDADQGTSSSESDADRGENATESTEVPSINVDLSP